MINSIFENLFEPLPEDEASNRRESLFRDMREVEETLRSRVDDNNIDPVAKKFIAKASFFIRQEVKNTLKDPSLVEEILGDIPEDELTNMLLRYKLLIEKRLFGRS